MIQFVNIGRAVQAFVRSPRFLMATLSAIFASQLPLSAASQSCDVPRACAMVSNCLIRLKESEIPADRRAINTALRIGNGGHLKKGVHDCYRKKYKGSTTEYFKYMDKCTDDSMLKVGRFLREHGDLCGKYGKPISWVCVGKVNGKDATCVIDGGVCRGGKAPGAKCEGNGFEGKVEKQFG